MARNRYIVAITGASSSILGIRFVQELMKYGDIHLVISSNTFPIIKEETGLNWRDNSQENIRAYFNNQNIFLYPNTDLFSPPASGSFMTNGMFIVPCTMKTLSGVANGYGNNLIERAADVTIKEGRRLILSPREMPFSPIHLENMLKLSRIGVTIAPPVPAFYCKPKTIDDVIDFLVGKILDQVPLEHDLYKRWS